MENDTRIITAISSLNNALDYLDHHPLTSFAIKSAKTSIRKAQTLLRNTRTDFRFNKIEQDIEILKELALKTGAVK